MDVYGVDFTSAPTKHKPITVAKGRFEERELRIEELEALESFGAFDQFLNRSGEWVAGVDFPFGQPRKFVENIGWPSTWTRYVASVADMDKNAFECLIRNYQQGRPRGDVRHFRQVDMAAGACSPMQLAFVPVGKMFFQGAPRLLSSRCRSTRSLAATRDELWSRRTRSSS